jgi:DNA-binding transcriptional MerR regulator
MKKYSISEVCSLLGVKAYVLRYWEQEIPFISPEKSLTGRRIYHDRDIQILFRLRHLLYDKKYTIEGARNRILEEIDSDKLDVTSSIRQIRSDLVGILAKMREKRKSDDLQDQE